MFLKFICFIIKYVQWNNILKFWNNILRHLNVQRILIEWNLKLKKFENVLKINKLHKLIDYLSEFLYISIEIFLNLNKYID